MQEILLFPYSLWSITIRTFFFFWCYRVKLETLHLIGMCSCLRHNFSPYCSGYFRERVSPFAQPSLHWDSLILCFPQSVTWVTDECHHVQLFFCWNGGGSLELFFAQAGLKSWFSVSQLLKELRRQTGILLIRIFSFILIHCLSGFNVLIKYILK
jgi:hypothetical protein